MPWALGAQTGSRTATKEGKEEAALSGTWDQGATSSGLLRPLLCSDAGAIPGDRQAPWKAQGSPAVTSAVLHLLAPITLRLCLCSPGCHTQRNQKCLSSLPLSPPKSLAFSRPNPLLLFLGKGQAHCLAHEGQGHSRRIISWPFSPGKPSASARSLLSPGF